MLYYYIIFFIRLKHSALLLSYFCNNNKDTKTDTFSAVFIMRRESQAYFLFHSNKTKLANSSVFYLHVYCLYEGQCLFICISIRDSLSWYIRQKYCHLSFLIIYCENYYFLHLFSFISLFTKAP